MVTYQQSSQSAESTGGYTLSRVLAYLSAKKKHIITAFIVVVSISIYLQPQSFINLWLTRDQQGKIYFERGNFEKAAFTFVDNKWVAYSYYLSGDFQQAAAMYAEFDDINSKFAAANANAHYGKYMLAIEQFEQVLKLEPEHAGAKFNKDMLEKLLATMVKKPGSKSMDDDGKIVFRKQKMDVKDKKEEAAKKSISDTLWLEHVQKNPAKFLRKKFQQEYINASN